MEHELPALPSGRIGKSTGICVPSGICKHPINFFNILKDLAVLVRSAGRLLTWYAEPWGLTEQPAILPSQSKAVHPSHTIRMFSHHKSSRVFTPIYPSPIFTRSPGQIKEVSDENTAAVHFKLGSVDRSTGRPKLRTHTQRAHDVWFDLWNPMDLSMDLSRFRLSPTTYKFEGRKSLPCTRATYTPRCLRMEIVEANMPLTGLESRDLDLRLALCQRMPPDITFLHRCKEVICRI